MAGLVTIFGGSGFIGASLVRLLAKQGWTIRVAVRRPLEARDLQPLGDVGQICPVPCKVQDAALVRDALAGATAAINLTGILYERGSQTFDAVHAQGAGNVAKACAELGVERLVHMSALGADAQSESAYARSKAAGEAAVQAALPGVSIVRPSIVFGPGDSFFNRFAEMAQFTPALPLIGGGETKFQPVFVGDVAAAMVTCLGGGEHAGQIYELGGPKVYSFRALLELMLAETCRRRALVSIPFGLAMFQAAFLERLPVPPLTRDQVKLLKTDNVVSADAKGLAELGIEPTAVEAVLPIYIDCYRIGGRYERPASALGDGSVSN